MPISPDSLQFDPSELMSTPEESARLHHELQEARLRDAFRAVVEYRRSHSHFLARTVATVYVPVCEDCYAYHRRQPEEDDETWRPADIGIDSWQEDIMDNGADEDEIARIGGDGGGIEPNCYRCRARISYGNEFVYVESIPFSVFFDELLPEEGPERQRPPRWMKKLVYKAYGGRCFGCKEEVSRKQMSADHILPASAGGGTVLLNLQLLCHRCNTVLKNSQLPEVEEVAFHFPLVPAPCDSWDSDIW